jgi:hypothetical protein
MLFYEPMEIQFPILQFLHLPLVKTSAHAQVVRCGQLYLAEDVNEKKEDAMKAKGEMPPPLKYRS